MNADRQQLHNVIHQVYISYKNEEKIQENGTHVEDIDLYLSRKMRRSFGPLEAPYSLSILRLLLYRYLYCRYETGASYYCLLN